MSIRSSGSLHSSSDSEGPTCVLPAAIPPPHRPRSPLASSVDSLMVRAMRQLSTSSPVSTPEIQRRITHSSPRNYSELMAHILERAPHPTPEFRLLNCSKALLNPTANRYNDYVPTDIGLIAVANNERYINASRFKEIVITQGPKEHMVGDFWLMLFEQRISHLVCLTNPFETRNELVEHKTFPYWNPANRAREELQEQEVVFANDAITTRRHTLTQMKILGEALSDQFVEGETFAIQVGQEVRLVETLRFVNWPDHGVCNPRTLLELLRVLLRLLRPCLPAVHCSAGVGRSGVFAVLYELLRTRRTEMPTDHEIIETIIALRRLRPGSVMYANQLQLLYKVLDLYFSEG